jgi:hypothetical protein
MKDVRFICAREDALRAGALAEILEAAGLSVADGPNDEAQASIILWSDAASARTGFLRVALETSDAGDVIIVALTPPRVNKLFGAAVYDLSSWDGETDDETLGDVVAAAIALCPKLPEDVAEPQSQSSPTQAQLAVEGVERWMRLSAEYQGRRRRRLAAVVVAASLLVGISQFEAPAPAGQAAPPSDVALVMVHEPVDMDQPAVLAEQEVLPPRYLLEPASAPPV